MAHLVTPTLEEIAAMEQHETYEFKAAVEEWRVKKLQGDDGVKVVEAGGGFARSTSASDDELLDLDGALSPETMAALRSHLIQADAAASADELAEASFTMPSEDFRMSQFWWDEASSDLLAREAMATAAAPRCLGVLSAPSVFLAVERFAAVGGELAEVAAATKPLLLEYDRRFASKGEAFVYFDFNDLASIPERLKGSCDYLVAGLPYFSVDCIEKYSES